MTQQILGFGNGVNTGTGDTLDAAMLKVQHNFYELYPTNTIFAAASDFTGTKEQRITAAISAAVAAGKTYVEISPTSWDGIPLLPYNPALVTFNSGVIMTVEGGRRDVFSVQAYGAYGNGTTDDTAAFQAAILGAEAIATGGGETGEGQVVFVPADTYLIQGTLAITGHIVLEGAVYGGSTITFNITPTPVTCINWDISVLQVRFGFGCRNLTFQGQGAADGLVLFTLTNCMGITFDACTFENAQIAFGTLTQTSWPVWRDCFFSNCTTCFNDNAATGSNENLLWEHCSFSQNISAAVGNFGVVLCDPVADYHFIACSFDGVRLVLQSGAVTTVGCHFEYQVTGGTTLIVDQTPGGDWTSVGDWFLTQSTTSEIIFLQFSRASIGGKWVASGDSSTVPAFVHVGGGASVTISMQDTTAHANVFALFIGTSTGVCGVVGMPDTPSPDRGNNSIVLAPMRDYQTQYFNTPFTGNQTITVNALGLTYYGLKYRVVMTAAVTGGHTLTFAGKAMTAGTWCEAVVTQGGTLLEVASGSL